MRAWSWLRFFLLVAMMCGCMARTDLRVPKQLGDDCLANAECPEACIGGTCADYAEGGEVCDDPEDCVDHGYLCPAGFCVEPNVCGNGAREGAEACDDGDTITETACEYGTASCTLCNAGCTQELSLTGNVCGDSNEEAANETCDDGNTVTESCAYGQTSCLVCDATCQEVAGATSFCGDSVTDGGNGEACDDGAGTNSDAWALTEHCNSTCAGPAPYCGDGTLDSPDEACDDDGIVSGDGCDAACEVESGWQCTTESPSQCYPEPGPEFVLVTPDTFTMGSPDSPPEEGRQVNEVQHEVTLTGAFWIQATELTQEQFETVMGWNPSYFGPNGAGADCGASCPVEDVSWFDMVAYMNELSIDESLTPCYLLSNVVCVDATGVGSTYMSCMNTMQGGIDTADVALNGVSSVYDCTGYRLPTEAEWEYAARAGTTAATYNVVAPHFGELDGKTVCDSPHETLDPIAWFCGNDSNSTEVVGQLQPYALGLYDMLGNVWEWCWDWYDTYTRQPLP